MNSTLNILAPIAIVIVAIVLVMGLWNMVKGGSPNKSQALMRMRVILQAVAIVILLGLMWASGRGP